MFPLVPYVARSIGDWMMSFTVSAIGFLIWRIRSKKSSVNGPESKR